MSDIQHLRIERSGLVFTGASISTYMGDRASFAELPEDLRNLKLAGHPDNQDYALMTPQGYFMGDGMSRSRKGGAASKIVVTEVSDFLRREGSNEMPPKQVLQTLGAAAAYADRALAHELGQEVGKTTFDVLAFTSKLGVLASLHVGDATTQQIRHGRVLYVSSPQEVPADYKNASDRGAITNSFAGRGRPSWMQAAKLSLRTGMDARLFRDETQLLEVQAGDSLFMYTDGVAGKGKDVAGNDIVLDAARIAQECAGLTTATGQVVRLTGLPERIRRQVAEQYSLRLQSGKPIDEYNQPYFQPAVDDVSGIAITVQPA